VKKPAPHAPVAAEMHQAEHERWEHVRDRAFLYDDRKALAELVMADDLEEADMAAVARALAEKRPRGRPSVPQEQIDFYERVERQRQFKDLAHRLDGTWDGKETSVYAVLKQMAEGAVASIECKRQFRFDPDTRKKQIRQHHAAYKKRYERGQREALKLGDKK